MTSLTPGVLATIHAALALETALLTHLKAPGPDSSSASDDGAGPTPSHPALVVSVTPWCTVQRVVPLVQSWVDGQVATLQGWVKRVVQGEDWSAPMHPGVVSRTVVDIARIANDAMEAFFDMRLVVPAAVVRRMVDGVDGVLTMYCQGTTVGVGPADSLIPPAPPLTRCLPNCLPMAVWSQAVGLIASNYYSNCMFAIAGTRRTWSSRHSRPNPVGPAAAQKAEGTG